MTGIRYPCFTTVLVLGLVGQQAPAAAQQCASGGLTLEARAAEPLPVTFGIEGVTTALGGSLALWSAEGEIISIAADRTITRQKLPDSIRPAGAELVPGGTLILDRYSGREFLLGADGALSLTGLGSPIAEGERLDQAIRLGGVWILGLREAFSREFRVRRGGTTVFRSAPGPTLKTTPRYLISADGGSPLLTQMMAPFQLIRLNPDGRVDTLASSLDSALAGSIPPDSLPNWRALPAVAIDCGLLLTLTDLTADRRLLIRVNPDGQVVRVTPLDAPLGLMARLPGETAVLAARRVGALELVWYDWRWIRESAITP